jgi:uncharacterized protein
MQNHITAEITHMYREPNLIQNGIVVRKSSIHGYGVFAEKAIKKNEVIEECHIFFTEGNEKGLTNYYYAIDNQNALLSGQGLLYNHSYQPNVDYFFDLERKLAVFKANISIKAGEELLISYGENWFSSRNLRVKKISRWKMWFYPKYSFFMRAGIVCAVVLLLTKLIPYMPFSFLILSNHLPQ